MGGSDRHCSEQPKRRRIILPYSLLSLLSRPLGESDDSPAERRSASVTACMTSWLKVVALYPAYPSGWRQLLLPDNTVGLRGTPVGAVMALPLPADGKAAKEISIHLIFPIVEFGN